MLRFLSAEWLRIGRFWLPWVLMGLLVVIVILQVDAETNRLEELETELAEAPATLESATPAELAEQQGNQYEADWLRENLRYPAVIGYAVRIATDYGWFFLILLAAVMGGEDFTRRTLRGILMRGIGRGRYLVVRCLILWLAAGVGVLVVTLLAAAGGPYVHARVTGDPISLEGLGEPLLVAVRAWLACLPFIIATLFWAVLARQAGPAMGVGIGLRAFELLSGFVLPIFAIAIANGAEVSPIFHWEVRLWSVSLGYNADVFLNWGSPFTRAILATDVMGLDPDAGALLPTTPWRAVAFLAGYAVLFLGWTMWILRRRDVTYGK